MLLLACQENPAGPERVPGFLDRDAHEQTAIAATPVISMVNKIAYVGPNGDLFTIDPDGNDRMNLTGGAGVGSETPGGVLASTADFNNFYCWPTWSPDGSRLAASRVATAGGQPEVSVEVFDMVSGGVRTVYKNETPSLIAQGAPHYLYWSPDSRSLAFLVSAPQAFALLVGDTLDPGSGRELSAPEVIETGAPLYFHWGQDGGAILLHAQDDLKLARTPFDCGSSTLLRVGQGFRAPAISPNGGRIAYTVMNDDGYGASLFVGEIDDPNSASAILEVGPLAAFTWSPDGSELAVVDQGETGPSGVPRLLLVSPQGGPARTLAEEMIVAFFWAPTGDKIAWVTVDSQDQLLEWKVSPVDVPAARSLFRFHPSGDVLTMLNFFDQYAYSHSPWSPDGGWLVVAGTQEQPFTRRNGGSPGGERIFVLDASGATEPRELAEGSVGFWSWT